MITGLIYIFIGCFSSIPAFDIMEANIEPRSKIEEENWSITVHKIETNILGAFSDCVNNQVILFGHEEKIELNYDGLLIHEYIHILQVKEMGCPRYIAQSIFDSFPLDKPAYQAQYCFEREGNRDMFIYYITNNGYTIEEALNILDHAPCD